MCKAKVLWKVVTNVNAELALNIRSWTRTISTQAINWKKNGSLSHQTLHLKVASFNSNAESRLLPHWKLILLSYSALWSHLISFLLTLTNFKMSWSLNNWRNQISKLYFVFFLFLCFKNLIFYSFRLLTFSSNSTN